MLDTELTQVPGELLHWQDAAHLFMQLYDMLDEEIFHDGRASRWSAEPEFRNTVAEVEEHLLHYGYVAQVSPGATVNTVDQYLLLATVRGIDGALWHANPFANAYESGRLTEIAIRYARTGAFNDPQCVDGLLLPRCAMPGRPLGSGRKEDFFSVHRVSAEVARHVCHSRLPASHEPFSPGAELLVACAPFMDSFEEMGLSVDLEHGPASYGFAPRYSDALVERIRTVVRKMDDAGAHIGMIPEGSLSREILEAWRKVAKDTATPSSSLRWILVGSGPCHPSYPPPNRAVLIDRISGEVVMTQDKMARFTITRSQAREWEVPWDPAIGRVVEGIRVGSVLEMRDSIVGRLIIAICEDLAQRMSWSREAAAFGVSHILVPIFSKPIIEFHWEQQSAVQLVTDLGAWVVVANSLTIARETAHGEGGTCAIFGPGDPDREEWHRCIPEFGTSDEVDALGRTSSGSLPSIRSGLLPASWCDVGG
ncbi:hypothetical protein [Nucisporomicrobium flavum]|uniref:hypothetical protein n=1 Tax=Nucisporomicrobium flavum TaxID=2785915 RepID=UPI0018F5C66B|nr:hypothetical protein [Nucisporomicrobium flavum]